MPKAQKAITETELTEEYTPTDPQLSDEPILYDSRLGQKIPLSLEKNGQTFRVSHALKPLSNESYLEYLEKITDIAGRMKKFSTAVFDPQYQLWFDLVESREGYTERPDWKEKTHINDAVAVIAGMLNTQILENEDIEVTQKVDVYDDESLNVIAFRAMQNGSLITLSHSFREETKAEADEFLAIMENQPNENSLASAEKLSKGEKLYRLGKKVMKDRDGYADGCETPAWHLAATTESFFARQTARLGKFLVP